MGSHGAGLFGIRKHRSKLISKTANLLVVRREPIITYRLAIGNCRCNATADVSGTFVEHEFITVDSNFTRNT